jgi:hypothetical protein
MRGERERVKGEHRTTSPLGLRGVNTSPRTPNRVRCTPHGGCRPCRPHRFTPHGSGHVRPADVCTVTLRMLRGASDSAAVARGKIGSQNSGRARRGFGRGRGPR